MNHTPGPWQVSISDDARIEARITTEDGAPVFVGRFVNYDNARLIAAAPDLLAALRLILESEETHGDSVVCDFETLQSVARAAVAKAIGE